MKEMAARMTGSQKAASTGSRLCGAMARHRTIAILKAIVATAAPKRRGFRPIRATDRIVTTIDVSKARRTMARVVDQIDTSMVRLPSVAHVNTRKSITLVTKVTGTVQSWSPPLRLTVEHMSKPAIAMRLSPMGK